MTSATMLASGLLVLSALSTFTIFVPVHAKDTAIIIRLNEDDPQKSDAIVTDLDKDAQYRSETYLPAPSKKKKSSKYSTPVSGLLLDKDLSYVLLRPEDADNLKLNNVPDDSKKATRYYIITDKDDKPYNRSNSGRSSRRVPSEDDTVTLEIIKDDDEDTSDNHNTESEKYPVRAGPPPPPPFKESSSSSSVPYVSHSSPRHPVELSRPTYKSHSSGVERPVHPRAPIAPRSPLFSLPPVPRYHSRELYPPYPPRKFEYGPPAPNFAGPRLYPMPPPGPFRGFLIRGSPVYHSGPAYNPGLPVADAYLYTPPSSPIRDGSGKYSMGKPGILLPILPPGSSIKTSEPSYYSGPSSYGTKPEKPSAYTGNKYGLKPVSADRGYYTGSAGPSSYGYKKPLSPSPIPDKYPIETPDYYDSGKEKSGTKDYNPSHYLKTGPSLPESDSYSNHPQARPEPYSNYKPNTKVHNYPSTYTSEYPEKHSDTPSSYGDSFQKYPLSSPDYSDHPKDIPSSYGSSKDYPKDSYSSYKPSTGYTKDSPSSYEPPSGYNKISHSPYEPPSSFIKDSHSSYESPSDYTKDIHSSYEPPSGYTKDSHSSYEPPSGYTKDSHSSYKPSGYIDDSHSSYRPTSDYTKDSHSPKYHKSTYSSHGSLPDHSKDIHSSYGPSGSIKESAPSYGSSPEHPKDSYSSYGSSPDYPKDSHSHHGPSDDYHKDSYSSHGPPSQYSKDVSSSYNDPPSYSKPSYNSYENPSAAYFTEEDAVSSPGPHHHPKSFAPLRKPLAPESEKHNEYQQALDISSEVPDYHKAKKNYQPVRPPPISSMSVDKLYPPLPPPRNPNIYSSNEEEGSKENHHDPHHHYDYHHVPLRNNPPPPPPSSPPYTPRSQTHSNSETTYSSSSGYGNAYPHSGERAYYTSSNTPSYFSSEPEHHSSEEHDDDHYIDKPTAASKPYRDSAADHSYKQVSSPGYKSYSPSPSRPPSSRGYKSRNYDRPKGSDNYSTLKYASEPPSSQTSIYVESLPSKPKFLSDVDTEKNYQSQKYRKRPRLKYGIKPTRPYKSHYSKATIPPAEYTTWNYPTTTYKPTLTQPRYIANDKESYSKVPNSFEESPELDIDSTSAIPGEPGKDYPVLHRIPSTDFDCFNKAPGFYADIEHRCQVYYQCSDKGRVQSFLCPNGTIFNQKTFVCEWWHNVDCSKSERHFARNNELYKVPEPKHPIEQHYHPRSRSPEYSGVKKVKYYHPATNSHQPYQDYPEQMSNRHHHQHHDHHGNPNDEPRSQADYELYGSATERRSKLAIQNEKIKNEKDESFTSKEDTKTDKTRNDDKEKNKAYGAKLVKKELSSSKAKHLR